MRTTAGWYIEYIGKVYLRQIDTLDKAVFEKLLPSFQQINEEAEAAGQAEYDRISMLYAMVDHEIEMDELAEAAQKASIAYVEAMTSVRQVILNAMAQAVYHLFEQQILAFCCHELLKNDEKPGKTFNPKQAIDRIKEALNIDCRQFASYNKIQELRLVADTVKHADDGTSSSKLYERRPDMFTAPCMREDPVIFPQRKYPVMLPLAGEDLFVTSGDLKKYFDIVRSFWEEMIVKLKDKAPLR